MGFLDKLKVLAGTFSTRQNKYVPPAAETSAERALKELSPEEYDLYMSNELPHARENPGLTKGYVLPAKYGNWDDMQKDKVKADNEKYELFLKEQEELRKADVARASHDSLMRRHQPKSNPGPGY